MVKYFWDVHFSFVMVQNRNVDSNMDGFSANFCAVLAYCLEVGDVGLGVVVGNAVYVNCMTFVFYSIFQTSTGFSCVRKVTVFY